MTGIQISKVNGIKRFGQEGIMWQQSERLLENREDVKCSTDK